MANLSTYAADKALDALFRNVPYTSTPTYVALYTTDPAEPSATGAVEVVTTTTAYARLRLDTLLAAAANGQIANSAIAQWAQATADWGTVVGVGIVDAPSGAANVLASGPLDAPRQILAGDTFSMPINDILVAIA